MRCRKARSYLSAYCSDELVGRRKLAVAEHLSDCASCREEETAYRSVYLAARQIPSSKVKEDFNARLLNRVATERFAETRSKAYLPKSVPIMSWGRAIPVLATSLIVVLAAIFTFAPTDNGPISTPLAGGSGQIDYLTAQPTNNPNMTSAMHKDWSFADQIARAQRVNNITDQLIPQYGFSTLGQQAQFASGAAGFRHARPYVKSYYRLRPIIKFYRTTDSTPAPKGGDKTY